YVVTTVTCTCGNTFETRSTAENGVIHADVCSNCHPLHTGKQKILDTGGRVARVEQRYKKKAGKKYAGKPHTATRDGPGRPRAGPRAVRSRLPVAAAAPGTGTGQDTA